MVRWEVYFHDCFILCYVDFYWDWQVNTLDDTRISNNISFDAFLVRIHIMRVVCLSAYMNVCTCVCIYVCVCVYMYVYIYICVRTIKASVYLYKTDNIHQQEQRNRIKAKCKMREKRKASTDCANGVIQPIRCWYVTPCPFAHINKRTYGRIYA